MCIFSKILAVDIISHGLHLTNPAMIRQISTVLHFVTEMCMHAHISVTRWCIVGYETSALWELWDWSNRAYSCLTYFEGKLKKNNLLFISRMILNASRYWYFCDTIQHMNASISVFIQSSAIIMHAIYHDIKHNNTKTGAIHKSDLEIAKDTP